MIEFAARLFRPPGGMPLVLTVVSMVLLMSGTLGVIFCILNVMTGEGIGYLGKSSITGQRAWILVASSSLMSAMAGYLILTELRWSRHFLLLSQVLLFVLAALLGGLSSLSLRALLIEALWLSAIVWLFYGIPSATRYYDSLRGS